MRENLRTRKRIAMREHLASTAMRLFAERGFDNVTVDEIAEAADVGRKTVFNYFPRKEDLFFDRMGEIAAVLTETPHKRDPAWSPLEAYRMLAHTLVQTRSPYVVSGPDSLAFMEAVMSSATLQARVRSLRDQFVQVVSEALASSSGKAATDPDAFLAASMLLATWTAARIHAHHVFLQSQSDEQSLRAFLTLIDRGARGIEAAMNGSPYAERRPTNRSNDFSLALAGS